MTNVDELAQIIRQVDGQNSLGAAALAEAILHEIEISAARQPVGEAAAVVTTSERFTYGKLNGDLPDGAMLYAASQPVGEVSVKKEDANNYCLILRALGMDEEGDPVAEVKALIEAQDRQPVASNQVVEKIEQLAVDTQLVGEDTLAAIATKVGAYEYGQPDSRYYDFTAAQLQAFSAAVISRLLVEQGSDRA